jgi:hypothetical protein
MKRLNWVLFFLCLSVTLSGQKSSDFGVFGGVSSYFGDINTTRPLYSPLPAGGIFYRFNFHPRQSLRTNLFIGGLRGNDLDFKNDFQQLRAASFSGTVIEWALQFEFNFLPYSTQGRLWDYTPYLAGGAGITFVNTTVSAFVPVIPFSFGFKVNIHKNMGLEAEYGFRKTFYDNFDGLKDLVAPSDYSWIHNNDWYSYAGVAFTWKIFSNLAGCPAYGDGESKRKR